MSRGGILSFVVSVMIVAVSFKVASAIKCWRCTSDIPNATFCDEPFDASIVTEAQKRWAYVQCSDPPSQSNQRAVCKRVKHLIDDKHVILRSCYLEQVNAPKDECIHSYAEPSFIKTEFCETCSTDGCNSGPLNTTQSESIQLQEPISSNP